MSNANATNHLLKDALINGILNAVINGIINYFTIDKSAPIYLTQDSISGTAHTVFSGAVPLAVSLAFILTSIAYFTTKVPGKIPYFPKVFLLALKHSVYAFGLVTIAGLLIQRYAGQVEVTPVMAAVLAGIIAGIVAAVVDYGTKKNVVMISPLYMLRNNLQLTLLLAVMSLCSQPAAAQKQSAIPKAGVTMLKGTWFAGGTLSTGHRNAENENQLFLYVVDQDKNDFEVRADVGYIFRQNLGAGLGLLYGRTNETSTLKNSDGILTNKKQVGDYYAFRPFVKNFLPLGSSHQFYVVIPTELQIGFGNKLTEETTEGVLTRTYSKSQFYGIALRPGILAFVHKNFGFEINVGALGFNTSIENSSTTNQPKTKVRTRDLDLRINILNLSLGFVGYF